MLKISENNGTEEFGLVTPPLVGLPGSCSMYCHLRSCEIYHRQSEKTSLCPVSHHIAWNLPGGIRTTDETQQAVLINWLLVDVAVISNVEIKNKMGTDISIKLDDVIWRHMATIGSSR